MTRQELLKIAKSILFNTEMARAILDDRKTVTRRVIKLKYSNTHIKWHKDKYGKQLVEIQNDVEGETYGVRNDGTHWQRVLAMREIKLPYKVGDILYVRETWKQATTDYAGGGYALKDLYLYKADKDVDTDGMIVEDKWHPSIHMPKEAARIFLRVTDVRAERLQDIITNGCLTPSNIHKEGLHKPCILCIHPDFDCGDYIKNKTCDLVNKYIDLWNSTVKKSDLDRYGWDANPWVWVIEFERVEVK